MTLHTGLHSGRAGFEAEQRIIRVLAEGGCTDIVRHPHDSPEDQRGVDITATYEGLRVEVQAKSSLSLISKFRKKYGPDPERRKIILLAVRTNLGRGEAIRFTDGHIWQEFIKQFALLRAQGYAWRAPIVEAEPYAADYTEDDLFAAVWMLATTEAPLLHSAILFGLRISPLNETLNQRLLDTLVALRRAGVLTLTPDGEYVLTWDDTESSFAQV